MPKFTGHSLFTLRSILLNMNKKVKFIAYGALVAALYCAISLALLPMAFAQVQFRPAEALMVLSIFFPFAPAGLFIGCFITNLFSPYGILDVICGSSATLLAAVLIYLFSKKIENIVYRCIVCPFIAVIVNATIIGAVIYATQTPEAQAYSFFFFFWEIFLSEAVSVYLIGVPLIIFCQKNHLKINKLLS